MKIITSLLIASLLFICPQQNVAKAQSNGNEPKVVAAIVCGVVVIGVGVVVIIGLKKLCEKIPPVDGPPPTPPYHPSTVPTSSTNLPPWFKRISPPFTDYAVSVQDISSYQIPDNYSGAKSLSYFKALVAFKVQSSTNMRNWNEELTVTQWVSDVGSFSAVYQGGTNTLNTYSIGRTNYVPIDIGTGNEIGKFFRVVSP